MRTVLAAAALVVAAAISPALAGPYGTAPTCAFGTACPYPPNTPKAASFETRYGTPDSPYSGWESNPNLSVGGTGASK